MQKIENNFFTILLPDKGYKLVNKSTGKYYKKIILGKNDSSDNYTEEIDEKYINPEFIEQNELVIDLLLYSVDEIYTTVEPLLAMVPAIETENKVSKLINFYALMIKRGLKTKEEIPERFREEVNKLL